MMNIREFTGDDYPGYAEVVNAVYPEYPETVEELRHSDATRSDQVKFARFVATEGERIVGIGSYSQSLRMYHPQRFQVEIAVAPDVWGFGYGKGLYDEVMTALQAFDPIGFRTFLREDHQNAKRFAENRGFFVKQREQESSLDLATFDPAAYEAERNDARLAGIRFATYAELKAEASDWDDLHCRLEDFTYTVGEDIPHSEPTTRLPFDEWMKRFDDPNFVAEGQFYALDGDYIVGVSELWAPQNNPELHTGMTGVRREYRGRGLATVLKLKALTWAKERGAPAIRTWNEQNNNGMLGINFRLGFVKEPAWLIMNKELN